MIAAPARPGAPLCAPHEFGAAQGRGWSRAAAPRASALAGGAALCLHGGAGAAVNSYRFLHVTIDTPWHIFIFLLMGIFAPFVLMVVLMWRNSNRQHGQPKTPAAPTPPKPPITPEPPAR